MTLATLLFFTGFIQLTLKLSGTIDWAWWLVLLPWTLQAIATLSLLVINILEHKLNS